MPPHSERSAGGLAKGVGSSRSNVSCSKQPGVVQKAQRNYRLGRKHTRPDAELHGVTWYAVHERARRHDGPSDDGEAPRREGIGQFGASPTDVSRQRHRRLVISERPGGRPPPPNVPEKCNTTEFTKGAWEGVGSGVESFPPALHRLSRGARRVDNVWPA